MAGSVNLVYIINALGVGGAEVGMCRLLDGLDENKYDVTVVVLDGGSTGVEDQIPNWVNVLRFRHSSDNLLSSGRKFVHIVRDADVIVGSLFYSAMAAKLAGSINPAATVGTWRHITSFKTQNRRAMFNLTSDLTDVILADSEVVAETLVAETNIDSSLIHTVPIAGIKLSDYPTITHEATDTPVVGTVGRLTEQKNHSTILDVAERLQDTDLRFEIAGEGELRNQLETEIEKRELTDVNLRGFVEDVPGFLSDLDIYFQPSYHEGLCITVLEAMATSLPVVGSRTGGIRQNVKHGKSGFLFDATDIDSFTAAIYRLGNNAKLRAEFGKAGAQVVSENFTQAVLVSEFENATNEIS
ncbi:glycosyltransferase family 4 protein [Halobacterium salinarum]|uniref:glycosyltransferase family 4 protein n=1 Tax=Halobacterium salinarum TaxID=2242 RepID=UPI00255597A6|nr:glycosyltransferase family 4 protein [Halobacterium salinarum]MDL0128083.1 glycosyltransferase family 4 protein [Halobacterium salinarum]